MLLAVLMLIAGGAVLLVGAEAAIRGATRFAVAVGVSAFVLGALLFGIDIEGLSAALLASSRGQSAIAAGEAFGTVVFLFGVGFGVALLIAKRPVPAPSVQMILAPALPVAACSLTVYDQYVSRAEGGLLIAMYAGYVLAVVAEGRALRARSEELQKEAQEVRGGALRASVIGALGLLAVYGGAWLLVEGAVRILARTGLAGGFVGAALVGTLASLDEVLLETIPIRRGSPELATGNLFGTVAAFTTAVIGLAALIRPLLLDSAAAVALLATAILYCLVAVVFLVRGSAWRVTGAVVLALYVAWLVYSATL